MIGSYRQVRFRPDPGRWVLCCAYQTLSVQQNNWFQSVEQTNKHLNPGLTPVKTDPGLEHIQKPFLQAVGEVRNEFRILSSLDISRNIWPTREFVTKNLTVEAYRWDFASNRQTTYLGERHGYGLKRTNLVFCRLAHYSKYRRPASAPFEIKLHNRQGPDSVINRCNNDGY